MQVLRTIGWVLLVCAILIFSFYNWRPVEVMIWENMVLETKVPVLVVVAFLIGFAPLLAYHLSVKWSLKRRVRNLESSLKTLATTHRNDTEGQGQRWHQRQQTFQPKAWQRQRQKPMIQPNRQAASAVLEA